MGTLEIRCHNCGAVYEVMPECVYQVDTVGQKHIHPYRCPHCMAAMDVRLWDKLVNAFWTFEEVNKDLRSHSEGYEKPLFQASYKTHYVPARKFKV